VARAGERKRPPAFASRRSNFLLSSRQVQALRPSLAFDLNNDYVLADRKLVPEGEVIMALNICWLDDLAKAKETARQTKKPVLLDFFNPQ
jgi:hypothetical protein